MSNGIKVLVATKEGQNKTKGDFSWANEGELVTFGSVCCNSERCGCGRSMTGVETRKSTTTFLVKRKMIGRDDLIRLLAESHAAAFNLSADTASLHAREDADEILRIAEKFSEGTVLRLHSDGRIVARR
jgi:hypothetical protein